MAGNIKRRDNGKWRARYRDDAGREHARHFERKVDAQAWLDDVTASQVRGDYVHPQAGRQTFAAFAAEWLEAQPYADTTRTAMTGRLRGHILPTFGDRELRAIKPSHIQAWIAEKSDVLAPSTVGTLLANLSSILTAAVEDELLRRNPCTSKAVKAPTVTRDKVTPWTRLQVDAVIDAHPAAYRAMPLVAAGCGLRQGEVFGLRVEDVDFLRKTMHVRQQVQFIDGELRTYPPKYGSNRSTPLPDVVAFALSERIQKFGPGLGGLIFTSREKGMMERNHVNRNIWKPALRVAGIDPTRKNGMHALRHFYASVLLESGVGINAVAEFLGHKDPAFTLRVYGHLMPEAVDKARKAVDAAFAAAPVASRTGTHR